MSWTAPRASGTPPEYEDELTPAGPVSLGLTVLICLKPVLLLLGIAWLLGVPAGILLGMLGPAALLIGGAVLVYRLARHGSC